MDNYPLPASSPTLCTTQGRFVLGITLLRKAWLKLLILLPMVPSPILLARASSSADCVTEASIQV